ncbi:hypothetical protein ABZW30_30405 [Kitasatospora sp. NPDC004669]|uniref:hypothetical protein n=1 Tax=Kitasatospora sp. NPDC004669 TaxID=3154555 RepID=UPI0033B232E6
MFASGVSAGEKRDDPLPLRPYRLFEPDRHLLPHRLARLPAVRRPWLRAIYDRLGDGRQYQRTPEGSSCGST